MIIYYAGMEGSGGDLLAGGFGGLACVLSGQPLDTIKVKLQTHPHLYRSAYHAVAHTFREEGLRAFYAGATPAVISNVAENAVLFVFYVQCQRLVQWAAGSQDASEMTVLQRASAGSLAAVFSSVVINPPDRIKCKLQVRRQVLAEKVARLHHPAASVANSSWSVAREIARTEGLAGFFRGLTSTWAREVPGYFFFFAGYDAGRKLLTPPGKSYEHLSVWRLALAGGLAGCCYWGAMFPTDVVKSRIQVRGELSGSFWITLAGILRSEGEFCS